MYRGNAKITMERGERRVVMRCSVHQGGVDTGADVIRQGVSGLSGFPPSDVLEIFDLSRSYRGAEQEIEFVGKS